MNRNIGEGAAFSLEPMGFLRFLRGPLLALVAGLGLFTILMRPPLNDFGLMVGLMSFTALVSVFLAYGAYRLCWIHRSPKIQWTLTAAYAFSGLLVFLNVWIIARMMFASHHDLLLATVLLAFATGIAMSLGYFSSAAMTDRILILVQAARQIAQGHLATRISDPGRDEMAALALSFNDMAAQLQATEQKQRELDILRRDLIAWVSHDLRTPLTSIRAILEALGDGVVDDPETVQRYLKTAQRDIRSLSVLIDDLFEMAQMDAGGLHLERTTGSITDLISDTIERFSAIAAQQHVTLSGSVETEVDPVNIDIQRMNRVLSNLTSNALRHTPPNGHVHLCASRDTRGVVVEVEDSGEGIQPEDLAHVFERFFRGEKSRNRATGGSGLGLAIARGVVEAHGGEIRVESTPGKGARFWFTRPG
ncbi:MAG: HAMP domain-containing protein [Anaerolineaceae bacterium]|nr:HAMP domain-containing protein [Anaerolineaceae bacterium]